MDKELLYHRAYKTFGYQSQMLMLFEEMAELQKAVCDQIRGRNTLDNVIEEVADVEIMLEQLQYILMLPRTDIEEQKQYKLSRLQDTLDNYKK